MSVIVPYFTHPPESALILVVVIAWVAADSLSGLPSLPLAFDLRARKPSDGEKT
jgi:hypothetical protein